MRSLVVFVVLFVICLSQQQKDQQENLPADAKKVEYAERVIPEERVIMLNNDGEADEEVEEDIEETLNEVIENEWEVINEADKNMADTEEGLKKKTVKKYGRLEMVDIEEEQQQNAQKYGGEIEIENYEKQQQNAQIPRPDLHEEQESEKLTEDEMRAVKLYAEAIKYLGSEGRQTTKNEKTKYAYKMLDEAANLNHTKSMEMIAWAYLFGDHIRWNINEARRLLEELSLRGSAEAQLELGFLHATGVGVQNSSQSRALVYFTFSALGGNPLAQMALGYRYWSGVNVPTNCERALTWYQKVANVVSNEVKLSGGFAVHRVRLPDETEGGHGASSSNNALMDQNLLQYYRFLADKGDTQAQVGLGQLYMSGGRGVEQNVEQASHYFHVAAEGGSANAFAYLGKMYLDGSKSTPQNNNTAFQYFKRAVDKGNPVGQSGMGVMYLYGKGVDRDYQKAIKFFTLAAEQGWVDGQLNLGHMYFNGLGVRRDYKLAIKYFQLASQAGHILAFYNLAVIHATGTGVVRNCHTAVELYKNVAERGKWSDQLMEAYTAYKDGYTDQSAFKYLFMAELGYEIAQTNFAHILDKGSTQLFSEVLERALQHWQRSANQGYGLARVKLGDYYYYGWGTSVDYELAANQYKMATEQQHDAQAMFNLGYMHEQGLGIKKDIHLAKRFYDMSAETSTDAAVPVALAMLKLGALFGLHYFTESSWYHLAQFEVIFGAKWDLYMMAVLVGCVGAVFFYRRHR